MKMLPLKILALCAACPVGPRTTGPMRCLVTGLPLAEQAPKGCPEKHFEPTPLCDRHTAPATPAGQPADAPVRAGGCVGCGGEKFVARTPGEMEAVLRDHVQQ